MIGPIVAIIVAVVIVWLLLRHSDVSLGRPSNDAEAVTDDARYIEGEADSR